MISNKLHNLISCQYPILLAQLLVPVGIVKPGVVTCQLLPISYVTQSIAVIRVIHTSADICFSAVISEAPIVRRIDTKGP